MQTRGPLFAQSGRDRARVNASLVESLVRVNVPHTAQKFLIQQQRFDPRLPLLQPRQKIVERNVQRIRPQSLRAVQQPRAPLDSPEMADVVVNQQAFVEFENSARVGSRLGIEQQLAGHPQMNRKHALFQLQHDELAMPAHRFYKLTANAPTKHGEFLAHHVMRRKFSIQDAPPGELGRQRPDYRFYFR